MLCLTIMQIMTNFMSMACHSYDYTLPISTFPCYRFDEKRELSLVI